MPDCFEKQFKYTVIIVNNESGEAEDAFGTQEYEKAGGTVQLTKGCDWKDTKRPIETTVTKIGAIAHFSGRHNPCCRWVFTARGWVCIPIHC